jgi:hypothetical protein
MGNVALGATQVVSLDLTVLSGTQVPPDGSVITLVVSDKTEPFGLLWCDGAIGANGRSRIIHPAKPVDFRRKLFLYSGLSQRDSQRKVELAGASGEVNVNLKAPTTSVAHAPLVVKAAFRNSAGQILVQASDAKAIKVTPLLSYALTTTAGLVVPGQTIQFT